MHLTTIACTVLSVHVTAAVHVCALEAGVSDAATTFTFTECVVCTCV